MEMTIAEVLAARIEGLSKWSDRQSRTERLSELSALVSDLRKAGVIEDADFDHLHRLCFQSANA